ncbi:integrator complex subunit 8-like [Lineus longissimus]|uniref:integrator complex subunit 8-like n=1 Tax=Lineus longissimus TaxID=88925 RepID=UPI002B4CC038
MSEFDFKVARGRPSTPTKVSWFEFLLDPELLQKHLSQDNADPSATTLICQFLHHAEFSATQASRPPVAPEPMQEDGQEPLLPVRVENKKVQALKLLALKSAAFLNWNLNSLDKNLPAVIVFNILVEMVRLTQSGDTVIEPNAFRGYSVDDISALPDHILFAIQLYHRWCIRAVIKDSYPTKPSRINITVPGLTDIIVPQAANDATVKIARDQAEDSAEVLEKCLLVKRDVMMPSMASIGSLTEESEVLENHWDQGVRIASKEYLAQLSYELACWYFYRENYERASELFNMSNQLSTEVLTSTYVMIDQKRLRGYLHACSSLKGVSEERQLVSLLEKAEASKNDNFKNLVEILVDDNSKRELTISYRNSLLDDVQKLARSDELYFQVYTSNMIRSVLEGRAILTRYTSEMLDRQPEQVRFIIKVAEEAIKSCSYSQRLNIKCFLRYLCEALPPEKGFINAMIASPLQSYFSAEELDDINDILDEYTAMREVTFDSEFSMCNDEMPENELERQLLLVYDPPAIRDLVCKISRSVSPQQITNLCTRWRVSREINQGLMNLPPASKKEDPAIVYIMVAKAKHCLDIKLYDRARLLLGAADVQIKDLSYKLSKLIRYEILHVDLLQFLDLRTYAEGSSHSDVLKRCKTCITSLRLDSDIHPGNEVIGHSAAFLLTIQDWEYLRNLANTRNGYLEFSCLLADTCKELPNIKNARQPGKTLWEAVIQIFTASSQQKRNAGGNSNVFQRDGGAGLLSRADLVTFIQNIKEPFALSTLISLLAKLYTILKDNITSEISNEYLGLWPTVLLASSTDINVQAVCDALAIVLKHSLYTFPQNHAWLRTQADICFANAQYGPALKFYLEAGVVSSDFFTTVVPMIVYDDQVYKKMMRCCSSLQCFTQVAILSQFLDEVDYTTAFKALQEKISYDAMDTYYDCIWDGTILEFLIYLHNKKGEVDKRQKAVRCLGQLELNSNNIESVQHEASMIRKQRFLRAMAKQYL